MIYIQNLQHYHKIKWKDLTPKKNQIKKKKK